MNSEIAYYALDRTLVHGADAARILYKEDTSSTFSLLNSELDSIKEASSSSLIIQVYKDSKYGEFSSNILQREVIDDFARKAVEAVELLSPDPSRKLPDPDRCYKGSSFDLGQRDPGYENITAAAKKECLFSMEKAQESEIISTSDVYEDSCESLLMIDSQGFRGKADMTYYSLYSECVIKGKGDARPEGFWQESSLTFPDLLPTTAQTAWKRAHSMLNPRKIKSGNYPVILENNIAAKMTRPLLAALNGAALQQRSSFLLDTLGQQIFPERLTLSDRPHTHGAILSRFFDSEGVATADMDIIRNGVVSNYYLSTYYADKLGMAPTVESSTVPTLSPFGLKSQAEMIASLNKGILITGFNGGNSNPITGDFSYGIEGFYIENGQLIHPIKELNITGNFIDLWKGILHIGTDIRPNSVNRMPTLCFENASISGI